MVKYDNYEAESQFNMAIAYLKSVDNILRLCLMHSMANDVYGWLSSLRALNRCLSVKMNEVESKKVMDKFKEINKEIKENNVSQENLIKLLSSLDSLEIILRRVAQEKGMLLPGKEDITKTITQM